MSLRGFLTVLVLLGAVSVLCVGVPAYRQHLAIQEITRLGGLVDTKPHSSKWLRDCVGKRGMRPFEAVHDVFLDDAQITDATLRQINLLKPKQLTLANTPITETGLARLGKMSALKVLCLVDSAVTDAGIIRLKGLTHLEFLTLGGNAEVTDAGLAQLSGFAHLKVLGLSGTQVTDTGLGYLNALVHLELLDLEGTHVTDGGLANLRGLPSLETLSLSDTQVTDAGLAHLTGLKKLNELRVVDTRVTANGAAELERVLPSLRVVRQSDELPTTISRTVD